LEGAHGPGICILDPETTQLMDDLTPNFRASLLYLDTLLRKTPLTDEFIHIAQRAVMDQLPFQLDPALQTRRALYSSRGAIYRPSHDVESHHSF
jgi:hypothetical protein